MPAGGCRSSGWALVLLAVACVWISLFAESSQEVCFPSFLRLRPVLFLGFCRLLAVEQIVDVPLPQFKEEMIGVVQNRTVELIDETFTFDVRLLPKEFDEKVTKLNFPALGAELNVPTRNSTGSLSSLGWPWTTAIRGARLEASQVSWSWTRMALSSHVMVAPQSLGIRLATSFHGVKPEGWPW